MYIESVEIINIKSIERFRMKFPKPAGWHVIIGDNGAGKSSIVKAIALGLIGPAEFNAARIVLDDWLRQKTDKAEIRLLLYKDPEIDGHAGKRKAATKSVNSSITIRFPLADSSEVVRKLQAIGNIGTRSASAHNWSNAKGWFSAGFGPFRRFTGGNKDWERTYDFAPKAGAHLSLFGEDVALSESLRWLDTLHYKSVDNQRSVIERREAEHILKSLKSFINSNDFLPGGFRLDKIYSGGINFRNADGSIIPITQLSDGFRSVLSLTLELIRQLGRVYGDDRVASELSKNNNCIYLPGVVLIDEVDAHLHPTWQTRIGRWFVERFPKLQFIVTTHSPLICRMAFEGSIYRLAAPGSNEESSEITGLERDRLIYGNILDAYATDAFGEEVTEASPESREKLDRLIQMNRLYAYGKLPKEEEPEMRYLRQLFATDDTLVF